MSDLLLIGLGNTGLPFADHAARLTGAGSVVLVDPDVFTADNLAGQAISPRSVGAPKVEAAAARMAEINPGLRIERRKNRLEELPRSLFGGRVVVSGLDSRFARAALSEICFAVGCGLWLDMGVRPEGRLSRVSAVFPGVSEAACICCGWSQKDWDALSAEFSCGGAAISPPTRSPAFLGAAAAAVAAQLLERHLAGALPRGAEVMHHMTSLAAHKAWMTRVRRNGACRSPHRRWNVEGFGGRASECTLGDLAARAGALAAPGLPHVQRLRCACGAERPFLFVAARLDAGQTRCQACGQAQMRYGALDLTDEIDLSALEVYGPETAALTLAGIGIADGDVIRLGDRHFEVGVSARSI